MNANSNRSDPPRWANRLLRWYCTPTLLEEIEGDLREEFEYQLKHAGMLRAKLEYVRGVLGFIRPFAIKRKKNSLHYNTLFQMNMFKHYLVVAARNLRINAGYSLINIAGLTIGLTSFILIFIWVRSELSYDRYNERADRIYRVVENQYYENSEVFPVAVTPGPLAPYLKANFPEITHGTRVMPITFPLRSGE